MLKCWEENPSDRPTFAKLKNTMKEMERSHRVMHLLFSFILFLLMLLLLLLLYLFACLISFFFSWCCVGNS